MLVLLLVRLEHFINRCHDLVQHLLKSLIAGNYLGTVHIRNLLIQRISR